MTVVQTAVLPASAPALPVSAVNHTAAFLSLLGALLAIGIFRWFGLTDAGQCYFLVVVFVALPHLRPIAEPNYMGAVAGVDSAARLERVIVKIAGLAAVYGLLALSYFSFQGFYQSYVEPLAGLWSWLWLPLLVLAPPYIYITDRLMDDPEDGLFHWGQFVTGRFGGADWPAAQQYLLGWLVKGFFAPLMVGYVVHDIKWILTFDFSRDLTGLANYYSFAYKLTFLVNLIFAATGYLCTFRLFDTHIRSTEPTMTGWVVCILCYQPFWALFLGQFFRYEEGYYWGNWLASHPLLWSCWAVLIVCTLVIYGWTSFTFGIRFSNLTNRGILTNGPYRWMKHPSYVSKNIMWWLIAVPFVSNGPSTTILRNCVLLLCINAIYYLRAKTEERHLSRDPVYVAYSEWIATNGIYAKVRGGLKSLARRAL
jgi:isoprenylcysteine carboxyl methyltransferase (ICMT) family protein YpbQ